MDHDAHRSPQEVFDEHLHNRQYGWIADERTFARNYADDVVLLTGMGVFRGRNGVRQLAQILEDQLPGATYEFRTRLVEGEIAFLEWTARCATAKVEDGADSYWIRNSRIVAQTIHYTVTPVRPA